MATVLDTTFTFNRDADLYVAPEVTYATEVVPIATGLVKITGAGSAQQPRIYNEDPQRRNTYGQLDRLQAGFGAGQLSFPTLCKPAGSLGVVPEGALLYESWFGIQTINASTSVVYSQLPIGSARPSFTAWLKVGHTVWRCIGTVVSEAAYSARGGNTQDAYASMAWTCVFSEMQWTGTDELVGDEAALETDIVVKDSRKFTVGGLIIVDGDDNAGAGYTISDINYGTDTLTVTPGLVIGGSTDGLVTPWLPAGTEVGAAVASRKGLATHGSDNLPLLTSSVTMNNGILVDDGEKNNKDYADRIFSGDRTVQVATTIRNDANSTRFQYLHREDTRAAITIPSGNVAGSIVEMVANNVGLDFPTQDDDTRVNVAVGGSAYESASLNDAAVLTFK